MYVYVVMFFSSEMLPTIGQNLIERMDKVKDRLDELDSQLHDRIMEPLPRDHQQLVEQCQSEKVRIPCFFII